MDRMDEVMRNLGTAYVESLIGSEVSPIEKKLLAGLLTALLIDPTEDGGRGGLEPLDRHSGEAIDAAGIDTPGVYLKGASCLGAIRVVGMTWALFHQLPLGRYTADFALVSSSGRVVLECDGHDFHERTKEQAKRDRRRDRWMQSEGWIVLRFTGSEIWTDARACGEEVVKNLDRLTCEAIQRFVELADARRPGIQTSPEDL